MSEKPEISKKTGKIMPPKKDPTDVCNARRGTGEYCTRPSGWGTEHAGEGRCKFHGGMSTGRPKKSFSAAEYLNADIVRTFENISDEDPQALTNLDNEINVIRANFYDYLKNPAKDKTGKVIPTDVDILQKFVNTLVKLVELKAKTEGKINQQKIPTQIIVYYVNKVTNVLERHIKDPELRRRIAADMKSIDLQPESN